MLQLGADQRWLSEVGFSNGQTVLHQGVYPVQDYSSAVPWAREAPSAEALLAATVDSSFSSTGNPCLYIAVVDKSPSVCLDLGLACRACVWTCVFFFSSVFRHRLPLPLLLPSK